MAIFGPVRQRDETPSPTMRRYWDQMLRDPANAEYAVRANPTYAEQFYEAAEDSPLNYVAQSNSKPTKEVIGRSLRDPSVAEYVGGSNAPMVQQWYQKALVDTLPEMPSYGRAYSSYTTKELTDEEWSQLTGRQQRAVLGNQLLYAARDNPEQLEKVYDYLKIDPSKYLEGSSIRGYATMAEINRLLDDTDYSDDEQLSALDKLSQSVYTARTGEPYLNQVKFSGPIPEMSRVEGDPVDLLADLPAGIAALLGRATPVMPDAALENNIFSPMLNPDTIEKIRTVPGAAEALTRDLETALKGRSREQLSNMFRSYYSRVAEEFPEMAQTLDLDELLDFYGLK